MTSASLQAVFRPIGEPVGVGIIGCGYISGIYLANMPVWGNVRVIGVADAVPAAADARAAEFEVKPMEVHALLAHPEVEIILNLTVPNAHAEVGLAAIRAGKSVYNEKPLATTHADGVALMQEAARHGVLVGCAPDTFLGGGLQTGRNMIDSGAIGTPIGATGFMLTPGHERWHPQPDFYYQAGGGPMLDMGPYYLSALVAMLGPVRRVTGSVRASHPERTISSEPRRGERIPVEVPTHQAAVLDFASGPIATLVTSFDVTEGACPELEVYGSGGTLHLPDPNTFGGPIRRKAMGGDWEDVAITRPNTENGRGIGLSDMADALRTRRAPRASGALALHVLEVMEAVSAASTNGRHIEITSTITRPDPLPPAGA